MPKKRVPFWEFLSWNSTGWVVHLKYLLTGLGVNYFTEKTSWVNFFLNKWRTNYSTIRILTTRHNKTIKKIIRWKIPFWKSRRQVSYWEPPKVPCTKWQWTIRYRTTSLEEVSDSKKKNWSNWSNYSRIRNWIKTFNTIVKSTKQWKIPISKLKKQVHFWEPPQVLCTNWQWTVRSPTTSLGTNFSSKRKSWFNLLRMVMRGSVHG